MTIHDECEPPVGDPSPPPMRAWLVFSIWLMLCCTAVAITWLVTR